MRVLLCGGGTAGHVYPALAISEIIKRNNENAEFAYVVTKKGIENDLVKYKKYTIYARGVKKKSLTSNIRTLVITLKAIKRSKEIIKKFKPDIVIGTGGYTCFPVLYAAHKLHIKTVIHESNARPGKTTMILSKYMDLILLNYSEAQGYFKDSMNVKVVGTPIRDSFVKYKKEQGNNNGLTILCFGGSLGAKKINECAILIVKKIINQKDNIKLIWGCGKREYDKCKAELDKIDYPDDRVELNGYIDNMPKILPIADIVICRAGAMSIAEMAYNSKCTILIPSPNVADNHQLKNAQALADKNAAVLITEDKIGDIVFVINNLLDNEERRRELSFNIKGFANPESNKIIYKEIMKLI